MASGGFWKRAYDDYRSQQVTFEVKNYKELEPDDFRQVLGYTVGEYGKFAIIVSRADDENITPNEKDWVRTMWFEHGRLTLMVPAFLLARCVAKLRNAKRKFDYTEDLLGKRADLFVRPYLNLPQTHQCRKESPAIAGGSPLLALDMRASKLRSAIGVTPGTQLGRAD